MAKSKRKKKAPVRRSSFVFKGTEFFEDPCDDIAVLHAYGGQGVGGIKGIPALIVGPAGLVRLIEAKLRKP